MFTDLENADVLFEGLMQLDENYALSPSGEIVPHLMGILFEFLQFGVEVHVVIVRLGGFDLCFWRIHFCFILLLSTFLFLLFLALHSFFVFLSRPGLLLFVLELLFVAYSIVLAHDGLDLGLNVWVQFFHGRVQNVEAFLDAPFLVLGLTRNQEACDSFS